MLEMVRWSTFTATALLAVFGYSDQLRLIFTNQSTAGLSLIMVLVSLWSWASYTLYGWLHGDKKIFWSNLVGTLFIGLILISFLIY